MARPASAVMSNDDKKAAIKELKSQIKTVKADDKVAIKAHASNVKSFDKEAKARAKTLATLEAKLEKLVA